MHAVYCKSIYNYSQGLLSFLLHEPVHSVPEMFKETVNKLEDAGYNEVSAAHIEIVKHHAKEAFDELQRRQHTSQHQSSAAG